ncbi:MAG: glutamate formimidoyltransferase [Anaerolineales bacterium]|jgi:glutamate formiminotransferase/formiminotetrahydrofolate cyclodeaminase
MPNPIVECIANYSEARRPEVVEALAQVIAAVPEVILLDRHSDSDHNRSVLTFVGAPRAVEEAAFRSIRKAAELIDLNQHTGTHPRIGATDVVPFVPISGMTMEDCVAIARRLGERVGRELEIPVYLYEEAALRPDRVNLEDIRRGQYEGLREEIKTNADRKPDFGPARLGPAGATVIGARHPLVAYNVYLNTADIAVAKAIAKALRHSSGGFRYVKALGMLVEGRAQVSMNLTNFRQTPVHRVVETLRREAARYGTSIHHSELVGLIPQEALTESAAWYLQLEGFRNEQVLEKRMYGLTAEGSPAKSTPFLDQLAAGTAAPGGGAAAAYAGAMGAALVAMVARLTIGKKKYAEVEAQATEILNQAERLRGELKAAVDEDSAAFEQVMAAFKLPKETPEQEIIRRQAIETATQQAARIPLMVAEKAVNVMALAERMVALGNLNTISDAASAASLAQAALDSAGCNVRVNVASLHEKMIGEPFLIKLHALEERAGQLEKLVRQSLIERGGLPAA